MPPTETPALPRRLAGMLYEALLLIGVIAVLVLLPETIYAEHASRTAAPWLMWLHLELVLAAYFIWFWRHGGQTLAMKTWKIRLVPAQDRHDGSSGISLRQALLRHLLCWPSLALAGVGLLWALVDRDGQFLHDRLAGTCLILVSAAPPTTASRPQQTGKSRLA
ncbi:RDD domain containing protein (fragment) [Sterolibacterium denitrificans]|uniref:RDD domain containing protein n=1 Tax=Sterolibacterium denitrificans TaxID=157592 RepID=A0A7Z7HT03_9PROT